MILREAFAFNGNLVRVIYNKGDMGNKYKIRIKKPEFECFQFVTSFPTMGEAYRYFDLLVNGGK